MEKKSSKRGKKIRHPILEIIELACENEQPQTILKKPEEINFIKVFEKKVIKTKEEISFDDYIQFHEDEINHLITTVATTFKTRPHQASKIKSPSGLVTVQEMYSRLDEEECSEKEIDVMLHDRARLIKVSKKDFFAMFGISYSTHQTRLREEMEPSREVCLKVLVSLKSDADTSDILFRKLGYNLKESVDLDNLIMIGLDRFHYLGYNEYVYEFEDFLNQYGYTLYSCNLRV